MLSIFLSVEILEILVTEFAYIYIYILGDFNTNLLLKGIFILDN